MAEEGLDITTELFSNGTPGARPDSIIGKEAEAFMAANQKAPQTPANPPLPKPQPDNTASPDVAHAALQEIIALRDSIALNPALLEDANIQAKLGAYYEKAGQPNPFKPAGAQAAGGAAGSPDSKQAAPPATEVRSPFLKGVLGETQQDIVPLEQDAFVAAVNQKHTFDLTKPEDRGKFLNTVSKWRSDSSTLGEVRQNYEDLTKFINTLPSEILPAIKAVADGGDWKSALELAKNVVSYDRDWSTLPDADKKKFMASEFNMDIKDLEDLSDTGLAYTVKAAEKLYSLNRQTAKQVQLDQIQKADLRKQQYNTLLNNSVESFKKEWPGFDDTQIQQVHSVLAGNKLGNLLFDKDGLPKPETAKMVAFMMFGEDAIREAAGIASSKAAASVGTLYANGQGTKPSAPNGGGAGSAAATQAFNAQLAELTRLANGGAASNPYDSLISQQLKN